MSHGSDPAPQRSAGIFVGDYVTLGIRLRDGLLTSDGLLGDECYLTSIKDDFDNCLWEIIVQNQYSAIREYKEALLSNAVLTDRMESGTDNLDASEVSDLRIALKKSNESVKQLMKAAVNEKRLNEKLMAVKFGKPVAFGDPIQLRHVKSKKFLTVSSHLLAKEERENMKVSVESGGDSLSCLGFMPRYKYDREGQLMTNNSETLIRVHERPGEFIHAASTGSGWQQDEQIEINCSLESTSWVVSVYRRASDVTASKSIMAGQLVTFQDPDNLSCLTLDNQVPGITERARVVMSPQFQLAGGFSSETDVGTNLLWLIEKDSITSGGPVSIHSDQVTLRDLNSGLYMKFEPGGLVAVKDRFEASLFEFHNSQVAAGSESSTLLEDSAIHLSSGASWVGHSSAAGEATSKVSLRCGAKSDKGESLSLVVSANLFKKIGINLHIGVYATISLRNFERLSKEFQAGGTLTKQVADGAKRLFVSTASLCAFLEDSQDLLDMLEPPSKETITCRQNMMREQGLLDVLLDILEIAGSGTFDRVVVARRRRSLLETGREKSTVNMDSERASVTNLHSAQQKEQTAAVLPPALLSTFDKFAKRFLGANDTSTNSANGGRVLITSRRNKPGLSGNAAAAHQGLEMTTTAAPPPLQRRQSFASRPGMKEETLSDMSPLGGSSLRGVDEAHQTLSEQIAHACLEVLMHAISDNHANQLHIADRFPVLLSQVKQQRLAVLCVQEMLRDNLTILQTKVRQREIDMFVRLLAETEMGVTYLKLLQSTCSCPMGVDATQRMVTYALFANTLDVKEIVASAGLAETVSSSTKSGARSTLLLKKASDKLIARPSTKSSFVVTSASSRSINSSFVLNVIADSSALTQCDWHLEDSLFIRSKALDKAGDLFAQTLGMTLVTDGLPSLSVTWTIGGRNGDFSMAQLFGYHDKVPLAVICNTLSNHASKASQLFSGKFGSGKSDKRRTMQRKRTNKFNGNQTIAAIAQNKAQVAEYLIIQLYLVADLCLDRNYVAIGILENLYEYDVLVAMLKSESVPNKFKAPVCRILRCLYVDKEPQVATKFPRYVRTSISLTGGDESLFLGRQSESRLFKFALLQQILSTYTEISLNTSECDELSVEMLHLLEALVDFGFYVTPAQIHSVLAPLIGVLDDHRRPKHLKQYRKRNVTIRDPRDKLKSVTHGDKLPSAIRDGAKWEARWLTFCESLWGMFFIVVVVTVTVAMAFVQLFSAQDVPQFDYFTTAFFATELLLRIYCFKQVYGSALSFLHDRFNIIDALLVVLDFVVLGISMETHYIGIIRAVRSLRAVRMFRAIRLMKRVADRAINDEVLWVVPERFSALSEHEAPTLVHALKVLSKIYDRIQDKRMDLTIKAFALWCDDMKRNPKSDPLLVYERVMVAEETMSADISDKFDSVLLDIMMYSDSTLVQESLNLLMVHKSQQELYFHTAQNIQIIYSTRIENIYTDLMVLFKDLRRLAEMYEIWSEMSSAEDLASAAEVQAILTKMMSYAVKNNDDKTLGIKSLVLVDEEVQNLMRNLDAMSCFMALLDSLFDGGREALKPQIVDIMRQCNELICWFVKDCEANQCAAFKHIEWFVDRVDDGVNSSAVLRAILEGNRDLIKQCPRQFISDFAHKILANGRRPEYLDMYVGMTEFSELMDARVAAVENDISSHLTSREWKKHLLLWCCAPDSEAYAERRTAMGAYFNSNPPCTEEDLSPDLRYHIRLLSLLSSCNLGPKLLAIYPVHDVISALLDTSTIFPVKHALGHVLVEILKSGTDRVEKSEAFWTLLEQIAELLESLPKTCVVIATGHPTARIQAGEWLEACISILAVFFDAFELASFNENKVFERRSAKVAAIDPKAMIGRLSGALKTLIDTTSSRLGPALTQQVSLTILLLGTHFVGNQAMHAENEEEDEQIDNQLRTVRSRHKRSSVVFADIQQQYYRKQFKVFMGAVKDRSDNQSQNEVIQMFERIPSVRDNQVDSDVRFEPLIKKLTSHLRSMLTRSKLSNSMEEDVSDSAVRLLRTYRVIFESKLHFSLGNSVMFSVNDVHEGNKAAALRTIYNENGLTYLCLDLISVGIDHDLYIEAMKMLVVLLLKSGGCRAIQQTIHTYLMETDSVLFFELVFDLLESLKASSIKEVDASKIVTEKDLDNALPEELYVLHLLQLMCEGGFAPNKNQLREQAGNNKIVDVMESLASFVGVLSRNENIINCYIAACVLKTILRLVQGPCKGNQEQFVLHTELLVSLNRIIRASRPAANSMSPMWAFYLERLKESMIDVLRGIVEGQPQSSLVFERVTTTVDLSVLHALVFYQEDVEANDDMLLLLLHSRKMNRLQAKLFVFEKTLGSGFSAEKRILENKVALAEEEAREKEMSCVEVVWNQKVHKVHFHIPPFISDLSMESRVNVAESVIDCASQELKLVDFVRQSKLLFKESTHQQFLKTYGLSNLWNMKVHITKFMFANAFLLNCLVLVYYGLIHDGVAYNAADSHHGGSTDDAEPSGSDDTLAGGHRSLSTPEAGGNSTIHTIQGSLYLPPEANTIILSLSFLQILLATATLSIFIIVQMPVTFACQREKEKSTLLSAILYTAMDPLPLWYAVYLFFAIISVTHSRLFLSALLLDWVLLDATTWTLLMSVVLPARQLAATCILILIMLNIFSCINFELYRQDIVSTYQMTNPWEMLKLAISYGFRGEYGIDHEMNRTLSKRFVLDVAFYLVVLAVLREVFFAIIIDTFDSMHEHAHEKEHEKKNSCFICGVHRHDYEQVTVPGISKGFAHHRNVTHNTLSYLYFILSIWHQSQEEDNGIEMYVRSCLAHNDVSWFPIGVVTEASAAAHAEGEKSDDAGEVSHTVVGHGGGHGGGHKKKHGGGHGSVAVAHVVTAPHSAASPVASASAASFYAEMNEKIALMQAQINLLAKHLAAEEGPSGDSPSSPNRKHLSAAAQQSDHLVLRIEYSHPQYVTQREFMIAMQYVLDLGQRIKEATARLERHEQRIRDRQTTPTPTADAEVKSVVSVGTLAVVPGGVRTCTPLTVIPEDRDSHFEPQQVNRNVTSVTPPPPIATPYTPEGTRKSILKKSFTSSPEELPSFGAGRDAEGKVVTPEGSRKRSNSASKSVVFTTVYDSTTNVVDDNTVRHRHSPFNNGQDASWEF